MNAKKICVEEDQQISDNGDMDQKVIINSLNYDSLAKIFMLLPVPERINMEKVCTKWKEACQLAWYDIKKYKCQSSIGRCYDNRLLTQSYLEKILLRCGNYLNELSLSKVCNSSIMPFIGDHCKNLTTLECKFNDDSLIDNADHFVQAFTKLDKLKCIKITVGHNCSKRKIDLSAIIDSLPVEINEIHLFSEPICDYRVRNISMSVRRFGNLQKLTLVGIFLININYQEIADLTTLVYLSIGLHSKIHKNHSLFNKLVNLEYIDVTMGTMYYGDNISTKELETIFCTCKKLKHLDIPNGPYSVAEIPFERWINFQNLQHLGIFCHLKPGLANAIVKYCKNLKYLRIPNYYRNNTYSLQKLTELENLECLILSSPNYLHEESIIAISNNCKKLKRLVIPNCTIKPAIDDVPLSSPSVLDELSKLQYLEHLNLRGAKNLEDSTIIAIANNCKNLKRLDIRDSKTITKTAFVALTNLKNLQILNVSYLDIITNSFIIKLTGLKELDCSDCRELTNSGIIQFIKNNPDLEFLNVCSIEKITTNLIIAADEATKNRTNGIILHIRISNPSIIQATKSKIKSQWLVVGCEG